MDFVNSSEMIEFKSELIYWSNRVKEVIEHYQTNLDRNQINELIDLQNKILQVKSHILPNRRSNSTQPVYMPTSLMITPQIPKSTPISRVNSTRGSRTGSEDEEDRPRKSRSTRNSYHRSRKDRNEEVELSLALLKAIKYIDRK